MFGDEDMLADEWEQDRLLWEQQAREAQELCLWEWATEDGVFPSEEEEQV